ncbi:hypothetical protein EDEG_01501 [Edhazardia aedis USNM 41457]|uniref:Uncharacterized protein n=1 Tax=Edhazardia aedis (strain USNM 41457) TaxID=1003232 RepID=J9DNU3_EDHAE|nr:hypothetical protein EDEG_01501 [Edhazardia aedis USNM 41457]|eukprot:EJW04210.1 hypothetical protein EDEG_01501 [Edhazardia aedis USNM 41457]
MGEERQKNLFLRILRYCSCINAPNNHTNTESHTVTDHQVSSVEIVHEAFFPSYNENSTNDSVVLRDKVDDASTEDKEKPFTDGNGSLRSSDYIINPLGNLSAEFWSFYHSFPQEDQTETTVSEYKKTSEDEV